MNCICNISIPETDVLGGINLFKERHSTYDLLHNALLNCAARLHYEMLSDWMDQILTVKRAILEGDDAQHHFTATIVAIGLSLCVNAVM